MDLSYCDNFPRIRNKNKIVPFVYLGNRSTDAVSFHPVLLVVLIALDNEDAAFNNGNCNCNDQ